MNNERRKNLRNLLSEIKRNYNNLKSLEFEESFALGNIPENLQGSYRYGEAEEACENLDNAIDCMQQAIEYLEDIR